MKKTKIVCSTIFSREILRYFGGLDRILTPKKAVDKKLKTDETILGLGQGLIKDMIRSYHLDPSKVFIGYKTVIRFEDKVYENPCSKEESIKVLKRLAGRTHTNETTVACIMDSCLTIAVLSVELKMAVLEDKEIFNYVRQRQCLKSIGYYELKDNPLIISVGNPCVIEYSYAL